jgi:hypothetical protein
LEQANAGLKDVFKVQRNKVFGADDGSDFTGKRRRMEGATLEWVRFKVMLECNACFARVSKTRKASIALQDALIGLKSGHITLNRAPTGVPGLPCKNLQPHAR